MKRPRAGTEGPGPSSRHASLILLRAKSDSRPGLCVFYDRHTDTLVRLQGKAPREGDAGRLSEIADEARRALDTI